MQEKQANRKKIGLALGGGVARGLVHIGILKGFQNYNIPIDYITGISAGSIIGGLYAAGMDIDGMISQVPHLKWRDFAAIGFSRKGISSKPIEKIIRKYVGRVTFQDLKIPFACFATDILSGEGILLNTPDMEISKAIRASSSFPGIYAPFAYKGIYYCDGGVSTNVPTKQTRDMGADIVIAIDIIPQIKLKKVPHHIALIMDRGLDILHNHVANLSQHESDLILKPVTENISSLQIKKGPRLIELGLKCVEDNIEKIRTIIS